MMIMAITTADAAPIMIYSFFFAAGRLFFVTLVFFGCHLRPSLSVIQVSSHLLPFATGVPVRNRLLKS
jgi:hypothetical protein